MSTWPPAVVADWEFGAELRIRNLVVTRPNATPAPRITGPGALPGGTVGQVYPSQSMTGADGTPPYHWTASGGPPGLTIGTTSGTISGTPTAGGTFTVVVTLTDNTGAQTSRTYSLVIATPTPLTVTGPASMPTVVVGTPYPAQQMTSSGGTPPVTWSLQAAPPPLPNNIVDAAGNLIVDSAGNQIVSD